MHHSVVFLQLKYESKYILYVFYIFDQRFSYENIFNCQILKTSPLLNF